MSVWHKADDVDIDHSRKEVDFLVTSDDFGNIYLSVSFDQIKEIYERILKGGIVRHTTKQHLVSCYCRSVGECTHNLTAWKSAIDACVDDFAKELKRKLTLKAMEGRSGWDNPEWPREDILQCLREHIEKGDMVDVAAFAMFAWNQE